MNSTPPPLNKINQASDREIPAGIQGWSWGGFWLTWIWAIFNKTWIGLLALIPLVNLIMMVVLGIKGREWAWRNKKWGSIEEFNRVQKNWSTASWIVIAIGLIIGFSVAYMEDRAASKSEWDISLPQNQSKESDVSLDLTNNNISITPVANGPYPQPQLAFGKIDFLRMLNEIGFDDHWKKEFANYLSTPQLFWSECTASESSRAQMQGGMNQAEAQAHAIESCQSTTKIYYECLNSKKLDDAAMCLQQHISNVAENGD